ncbi:Flp family type IVb pilin [Sinorhizobium numidicum]|uniref:Flp family type IVb pilin n=1 Tax=Sinorhizobium numidicum TaxID=680248 RepID=A0ABY8CXR8_9HYPH|nr:Flp family type IVb pilin [Sinorhizobium numidicum]WEX76783.1 Flp family type IVb pilin [Sinorhizobium numidicum]WEX83444.1 Flp family type IVb pilin [Sinorhizobium numidicum]
MDKLRCLVRSRDGATVVEYGLLAALISVGLLVGLQNFSEALLGVFNIIVDAIETAWV